MEWVLFALMAAVMVPSLYVAGLHDVPNSIAIPVRTRAVSAKIAVRMAALFNGVGVLLALPLGLILYDWLQMPDIEPALVLLVLVASLSTLLAWNLLTYFRGMPTSSTHALLTSLLGGTVAAVWVSGADGELLSLPWLSPLLTLVLSPIAAFGLAYLLVFLAVRLARGEDPADVNRVSRALQSVSIGVTSLGTGLQQGQRFSFVLLLGFTAVGASNPGQWLGWVYALMVLLLVAGCLHGGWRIGHVLGHRLVTIDPLRGMVATTTTSGLLLVGSITLGLPLSTSLTAGSSVMGAGSNQRFATVNWRQFRMIAIYWLVTPLVCTATSGILVIAVGQFLF